MPPLFPWAIFRSHSPEDRQPPHSHSQSAWYS